MTTDPWTEERVSALRQLLADRVSFTRIATQLGVTRSAAIGKARRLGVETPKQSGEPVPVQSLLQRIEAMRHDHRPPVLMPPPPPRRQYRDLVFPRELVLPIVPIPPAVAIDPLNLTIDQLGAGHCRYITNDDLGRATYCGHRTINGTSWCSFHLARVSEPPPSLVPVRCDAGGSDAKRAKKGHGR